jgi:hypothetical protein
MSKDNRTINGLTWAILAVLAAMAAGYFGLWIYFCR